MYQRELEIENCYCNEDSLYENEYDILHNCQLSGVRGVSVKSIGTEKLATVKW